MADKKSKHTKYTTSDGYAYLTKRTVINTAKAAVKKAAKQAMEIMGYVVVAEGEWIVKKYKDGHTEKITKVG